MLIGLRSQRAERVAPRANAEVPPRPGSIISYPRIRNPFISLQLQQTRDDNADPPGRYRSARCGNPNPTDWLLIDCGSWSQRTARVALWANAEAPPHPGRMRSRPRRMRSHPRIRNPSISLQLQQTGDGNKIPGSIPLRTVWKPQPHWLVAGWLGLMEPTRGESCPSGQRRGPTAPGEDRVSSPDQSSLYISTTPATWGQKRRSPGSLPPRTVWKPQPTGWLLIGWGSWNQGAVRVAPPA